MEKESVITVQMDSKNGKLTINGGFVRSNEFHFDISTFADFRGVTEINGDAFYDVEAGASRRRLDGHASVVAEDYVPVVQDRKMLVLGIFAAFAVFAAIGIPQVVAFAASKDLRQARLSRHFDHDWIDIAMMHCRGARGHKLFDIERAATSPAS